MFSSGITVQDAQNVPSHSAQLYEDDLEDDFDEPGTFKTLSANGFIVLKGEIYSNLQQNRVQSSHHHAAGDAEAIADQIDS